MNITISKINELEHKIEFSIGDSFKCSMNLLIPEIEDLECELTDILHELSTYRRKHNGKALPNKCYP